MSSDPHDWEQVVELKGGVRTRSKHLAPPLGRMRVSAAELEVFSSLGLFVPPLKVERDEVTRLVFKRRLSGTRVVAVFAGGDVAKTWFVTRNPQQVRAVLQQFGWPVVT